MTLCRSPASAELLFERVLQNESRRIIGGGSTRKRISYISVKSYFPVRPVLSITCRPAAFGWPSDRANSVMVCCRAVQ